MVYNIAQNKYLFLCSYNGLSVHSTYYSLFSDTERPYNEIT